MKKNYFVSFKKPWRFLTTLLFLMFCCGFWAGAQDPHCSEGDIICIDGRVGDWGILHTMPISTYTYAKDPIVGLDDQFTTGAADANFAVKAWTYSQVKNKNNIANGAAVLIGTELYFAGDRTDTEGDAMIGFWFFQEGTAPLGVGTPGDKGYFEPLPAIGDLLVLANFSNGGRNASVIVYSVASYNYDNKGNISSWNFKEETGTGAAAAQNNDMECPVPVDWHYPTATYPLNAFYEGYVDLSSLVPEGEEINLCFGSFMLETRSSTSLTASLDDFVGGAFSTIPKIATEDDSVCEPGGEVTLCVVAPEGEELPDDLTFQWYYDADLTMPVTGEGNYGKDRCLTINITEETTFWVVATNGIGCESEKAMATGHLYPSPVCSIDGSLEVCPDDEFIYSAPAGMASYKWTISGNADIVGADNLQMVTIKSGQDCDNFTLYLTITDANGCSSNCDKPVDVNDEQKPVITNCPTEAVDLGCNPDPVKYEPSLVPEWSDNCGIKSTGVRPGTPAADAEGCGWSVTHIFYAIDFCDNEETCEQTFTWKVDKTAPEIKDIDDYMLEACNAEWPEKLTTSWTDNCSAGGNIDSDGGVNIESQDPCYQLRLYTFKVQDECGNEDTETVTVKRKWDKTAPEIKDIDDYMLEACNAEWPEKLTTSWTDNCSDGGDIDSDGGVDVEKEDPCFQWRLYTFKVQDECGNEDTETVTVKRKWDKTGPVMEPIEDLVFECEEPVMIPTPVFNDNCDGPILDYDCEVVGYPDADCATFEFPEGETTICFTATDECGNSTVECIKITVEPCIINCQTAYARLEGEEGESLATCFIGDGFNNWGWTNPIEEEGTYVLPLYAGAANCDPANGWGQVGTVTIVYGEGQMVVTYDIMEGYSMSEVHTFVGCYRYPKLKNGNNTIAPGQYTYNISTLERAGEYTVTFTDVSGEVWVIAHAVVCDIKAKAQDMLAGTSEVEIDCTKSATVNGFNQSELTVFPNPFTTSVTFEFVPGVNARAKLDIFNSVGQLVTTLIDQPVEKGVLNRIEYKPVMTPGLLYYRFTLDAEIFNGTLIYNKLK